MIYPREKYKSFSATRKRPQKENNKGGNSNFSTKFNSYVLKDQKSNK